MGLCPKPQGKRYMASRKIFLLIFPLYLTYLILDKTFRPVMNFNQKLRFTLSFILLFALYISCNKNDISKQSINETQLKNEVRDWVHEYGESYKTEKIHVLSSDKSIVEGSLDWDDASSYIYNGRQYLDVPFSFDGEHSISGNDSTISEMSYDLVVRKDSLNQSYEGSIRTTTKSVVEDIYGNNRDIKELQSFQNIDGSLSTIYLNNDKNSTVLAQRLYISKEAIAQLRYIRTLKLNDKSVASSKYKSGGLMLTQKPGDVLQDCNTYSSTTNVTHCYGPDASVTCYSQPETSYVTICGGDTYTGTSGGGGSSGGGGGTNQTWPPKNDNKDKDNSTKKDPCEEAKKAAEDVTKFSKENKYTEGKSLILNSDVSREHSIVFGKDVNGNIISSEMSSGSAISTTTPITVDNPFADLHNHPNKIPPSAGDLYNLGKLNNNHSSYTTDYVVFNNTTYALVITNSDDLHSFITKYPSVKIDGYPPDFPDLIFDDYTNVIDMNKASGYENSNAIALSYILDKYNTGVALLKQDDYGVFKKVNVVISVDSDGTKHYSIINCPS